MTGRLASWLLRHIGVWPAVVTVDGPSMAPAFQTGDRVLVRRRRVSALRIGDVVVVERPGPDGRWGPGHTRSPQWMIKRVAALPGDRVPELVDPARPPVPPGRLVLLGDNPSSSYDSRHIGLFPAERLLGAVARRLHRPGP